MLNISELCLHAAQLFPGTELLLNFTPHTTKPFRIIKYIASLSLKDNAFLKTNQKTHPQLKVFKPY